MPDRAYTAKTRAKRIVLDYFKRPHPFRRAKFLLSIAIPLIAAGVIAAYAITGDHRLYNSGPVSTAHAMFGARCENCHGVPPATGAGAKAGATFFRHVSNKACLTCHDGPVHRDRETTPPTCASCHFEHKGRARLADVSDRQCVQCHEALKTKDGRPPAFASNITDLSRHPQFAVTAAGASAPIRLDAKPRPTDTAQVCLNHKKHADSACTDCHQPDARGAYMAPISYAKHCAECHKLVFDKDDTVTPHDTPEIVHAFLRTRYAELPESSRGKGLREIETVVFFKNEQGAACSLCHNLTVREKSEPAARCADVNASPREAAASIDRLRSALRDDRGEKLPVVAPTHIPARWLPHSRFNHRAHRELTCTECHKAADSTKTADVLLPAVATCRECHRDTGGARTTCVECHLYHDKTKERAVDNPLTIRQLAGGAGAPAKAGSR